MAQSAFSRKTHGAAGTFDVPLPLTGNVGVECRSGGATNDYQMIINFATTVTVGSASVTSGTASVTSFSVSGSQVTVNLTGVTNVQRITVTLFNVNDGTHMGNVPVSMGVLVGDVNGNAVVNASDVSLTKSQVGQAVSGSNFREDNQRMAAGINRRVGRRIDCHQSKYTWRVRRAALLSANFRQKCAGCWLVVVAPD
ncbi:MAG: hypothetical protein DMG30_04475 [Acidobacteria bacterium]|nr:MAG: hypothetical protein DMG30_04475 [Acidobacteriota bacterium]